jgi:AraC-like DNA-binding protein
MEPQLPLLKYRQFESHSVDEVRDRIGRSYCPHKLQPTKRIGRLNACYHRAPLINTSINFLRYGAEVEIDPGALRSFYLLEIPLSGSACVRFRDHDAVSGPDRALIVSPTTPFTSIWSADCAQIMVKVDRMALEKYVMNLLDRPLAEPIEFEPELKLSSDAGARCRRMLSYIVSEIEESEDFLGNRMLAMEVERSLMAYLVHCQPNTYTEALAATAAPAAPRYIVKAIEFMRANLDRVISIDDLAAETGVGARALHEGFKRFRATTPMAMLRSMRLKQAREALLAADAREQVVTIARRCGFTHLGRFSQLYRTRYGETPSQTLRR